jgi:long-chain acyl-CoA synthetase
MQKKEGRLTNLAELVAVVEEQYKSPNMLNWRHDGIWHSLSTEYFTDTVRNLALGLRELGVTQGDNVAIIAQSSPEWIMFDLAVLSLGAVSVPMFANISSDNLDYQLKDSAIDYVFIGGSEEWNILESRAHKFKKIITLNIDVESRNIIDFAELIKLGIVAEDRRVLVTIQPDDLATIIYTSGSTGRPKGVELTHKNFTTHLADITQFYDIVENDKALSYLPLAHVFERIVMYFYLSRGVRVYFVDDLNNIAELMKLVQPHIMTTVPRLLEKIHDKMADKIAQTSGIKKKWAEAALRYARASQPIGFRGFKHILLMLLYRPIYKKLLAATGGNLKMMICGGAPLAQDIYAFFLNIGVKLYQAYGLTEACPGVCSNYPRKNKFPTCGVAFPSVRVKVTVENELIVKGDSIMRGYHNAPEKTAEVIDKNGWFYTGDLAKIDKDGFITITGRKKELCKTSNGKYISIIHIEQQLRNIEGVDSAMLIAEGCKFVSCIFFPQEGKILDENHLQGEINRINQKLDDWERIQKFYVAKQTPTVENELLTPSMKLKRHVVFEEYEQEIENMYG